MNTRIGVYTCNEKQTEKQGGHEWNWDRALNMFSDDTRIQAYERSQR